MEKTRISAKIVADSISPQSHRLTTVLCTIPRYILAELNTHRMFSRNSASSRAIPFKTMVEAVTRDPFIPYKWMKDHKGMQGTVFMDDSDSYHTTESWLVARDKAVDMATHMHERYNLTKQMCNRLLEPFMWHTVLISATEWENFFALRFNEAADIHIQILAEEILNVMNANAPSPKKEEEWHIPFGDQIDQRLLFESINPNSSHDLAEAMVKIAIARAARTSYTVFGTTMKDDYIGDIKLHDRLLAAPHVSPFEHVAQVPSEQEYELNVKGQLHWTGGQYDKPLPNDESMGWFGNFRGWKQYRKTLPNENREDDRLIKHEYSILKH